MMDETTVRSVADATKAAAETTGKALDIVDGIGRFSNRLIGEAIAEAGGMFSDQVKYWRKMRFLQLTTKFDAACAARGIDPATMRPLTLGETVRVFEAASMEESDEVQDLWAELLANAVDPKSGITLKKVHLSLLKEIGPAEAALLQLIVDLSAYHGKQFGPEGFAELERDLIELAERRWRKFTEGDRTTAIINLRRIGCVAPELTPPPTDRLLTQSAVQPAERGGFLRVRETRVTGIDPGEFVRFTDWLIDTMRATGGAKAPKLPDKYPLRNSLGGIVGYIAVPELALTLTPLGVDLMAACAKPAAQPDPSAEA